MATQAETSPSATSWLAYPLAFRLRSPVHVGWRKIGNLMQTRPYVPAKNLWGAVTAQLARTGAEARGRRATAADYREMGNRVTESVAFTYLFPSLAPDPRQALYPRWSGDRVLYGSAGLSADLFDYLLLDSYASTALNPEQYAAQEGSLHETEMIRPRTRPLASTSLETGGCSETDVLGAPVYLVGYTLVKAGSQLGWQDALRRLQVGGERRYGWGRLEMVEVSSPTTRLFGFYDLDPGDLPSPVLRLSQTSPALAHVLAMPFDGALPLPELAGVVEPVVGRETRVDQRPGFGAALSPARVCWIPGTMIPDAQQVVIGAYGIWQATSQ